jgi:uncharacterized membrane protein
MRRQLGSLFLVIVAGLCLGVLVHIVTIFAIPRLATHNAYARFGPPTAQSTLLYPAQTGRAELPEPDPAVAVAVCTFDVTNGPVIVRANVEPGFASLSVHGRRGHVYYAVTDEAAVRGQISLTLMTQAYFDDYVSGTEEASADTLRFITPATKGLVVMRALAAFPSQMPGAERAASSLSCEPQPAAEEN